MVCLGLWCLYKQTHLSMSLAIGQDRSGVVGCRKWPVMREPQFIALRGDNDMKDNKGMCVVKKRTCPGRTHRKSIWNNVHHRRIWHLDVSKNHFIWTVSCMAHCAEKQGQYHNNPTASYCLGAAEGIGIITEVSRMACAVYFDTSTDICFDNFNIRRLNIGLHDY